MKVSDAINLTKHVHLGEDEIKEIIPWLYYAAMVDPHNVQAYTLAGYYLSDRLSKEDEAIKFLRKGLAQNPESWEIYTEIGYIYFKQLEEYDIALRYLVIAWRLLQAVPHDKFQERFVLTLLANGYEKTSQHEKAYSIYVYLNDLFPNSVIFDKKINDLKEK